jgi:hypothetical protein
LEYKIIVVLLYEVGLMGIVNKNFKCKVPNIRKKEKKCD